MAGHMWPAGRQLPTPAVTESNWLSQGQWQAL